MLKRVIGAAIHPLPNGRCPRLLPEPYRHGCRSPRSSPASGRPEAETAQAAVAPSGSAILDVLTGGLVSLEGCAGNRPARNGRGLVSGWVSFVLVLEISAAWRSAADHWGSSRLIRRLAQENSHWGAPKIHGELQKLGCVLSERTVARYLRSLQRRGDPAKKWLAFLRNHREAIVALDLFTVPTASFRVLYCFFGIEQSAAGFSTSTLRGIITKN